MRDGEQSPWIALTLEQKVQTAKLLDEAGVFQIEAGIPVIGGYEVETIQEIVRQKGKARISVWCRAKQADIKAAERCQPDIIHISTPVSYAQIYSKLNKNKAWVTKNLLESVQTALDTGCEVTVGLEDASRADITFMMVLVARLKESGVSRVRFADTVGVMTPSQCGRAVKDLIQNTGMDVEIHTHNDLGMAVANTLEGAKQGARFVDTTLGGLGERAGNCSLTELIEAADRLYDFGITRLKALETQKQFFALIEQKN